MKNCIKFLLAVFAFSPLGSAVAAPISQTAGSNLTGYNGAMGSAAGNQWNTMTNSRQGSTSAKADYGNCEAVILRCAKPKCSGSGCTDFNVAKSIAAGCVNSNAACKKHGDALTEFIAGQLVSSAQAVAAQQQAAAQSAAAEQSAAQISAMQQQMQMQMQQMQEQNNAQLASLQNALEESQRAAAEAQAAAVQQAQQQAAAPDVNTGLTAVQTAAVKSGVSEDTIARATITGQIMSSMEGVDTSLANLKATMREAFRYAGCNEVNGDNCTGPKRVKKFKELSMKFFEPYDALVDNLDDALTRAQSVGVDMTDIYMMLNGSCNRWGEYLCQSVDGAYKSAIYVEFDNNGNCPSGKICNCKNGKSIKADVVKSGFECTGGTAVPPEADARCVLNKEMDEKEVQQSWLDPDGNVDNQVSIRIGCASSALQGSILGRRRAGGKKGGINIDVLERLIAQDAPNSFGASDKVNQAVIEEKIKTYCAVPNGMDEKLVSATVSKSLPKKVCCQKPADYENCTADCEENDEDVAYVNPMYALCSIHAYNAGKTQNKDDSAEQEEIKRIVGLKSTVISQQMYKQYTMVESMIKRLKVMLEKATLKASLQVAGGTSDEEDDDSGTESEFTDCRKGDDADVLNCLRDNFSRYQSYVSKGNAKRSVVKHMFDDMQVLKIYVEDPDKKLTKAGSCTEKMSSKKALADCNDALTQGINALNKQIKNSNNSGTGGFMMVPVGK